jgi:transcriptional regulator with XRE-family HTH domain
MQDEPPHPHAQTEHAHEKCIVLRGLCLVYRGGLNKANQRPHKDLPMTTPATAWVGEAMPSGVPAWGTPPALASQAHVAPPRPEASWPAVNDSVVSSLVGRNLRRLRKQHRLSLEALSRLSGVSRAMLGQIEQGKSIPSIKTLWQVAQALGVSVAWFLDAGSDSPVLLMAPPADSPQQLSDGEGELRSLQPVGDGMKDAFYELRLAPGAVLSLPAATSARRVNVAVSVGTLLVDVEGALHLLHAREALQYEARDDLVWRNDGNAEVQAYVVIREPARMV